MGLESHGVVPDPTDDPPKKRIAEKATMRTSLVYSFVLGAAVSMLTACSPSPAEVAQKFQTAVNAKNADGALALVAPAAMDSLKPVVQGMISKNTNLELVGQYQVEGDKVSALEKLTNDEYTKLGLGALDANFEGRVVGGKLTAAKVMLTPEAQTKIQGALGLLTKKVVDDFVTAVNAKNVDAAMALVADGAVFNLDDKRLSTAAEIKAYLTEMVAKNLNLAKSESTVAGNNVTWTTKESRDDWSKAKLGALDVQGTALVANGKIKDFSLALTPESAAKLKQLTATAAVTAKPAKKHRK
jgi:hypothetical protein